MSPRAASGVLVGIIGVAAATASPQDSLAPIDATVTVRLAAGKTTYAIGELIPLELEFRGRAEPDYYFWTGTYDRRGRMLYERYDVAPGNGNDDPLAEFFGAFGGPGGGLGGWQPLDGQPFLLSVPLNDWVRFTRPGDYKLVVTSRRLERYSGRTAPPLVSHPVDLHIQPAAPGWAAGEVARAIAAVQRGQSQGVTILRHLGTRESALALVKLYGAGGERAWFETLAGLVSSPYRKDIVAAMEARIDAGEPLPPRFLGDLAGLRSLLDLPVAGSDPRTRLNRLRADECAYMNRWGRVVTRRGASPEALAGLLASRVESAGCETDVADLMARHPVAARAAFLALPAETQSRLLEYRWTALDRDWIQPALEELLEKWTGDSRFPGAGDWALKRIVELDRARGRSLLLEEVRTGAHGLTSDTLTSLLGDPPADLDSTLIARFQAAHSDEGRANAMWLLANYGSPGLVPFVKGQIERGAPCALEAASLVYLLRHEPAVAVQRLGPGFDRRRRGMCVVSPWQEIAPRYWDERVEDAVIASLGARDPGLVLAAGQALHTYGSARAKEPLFDRLAEWEAEWRGREKELLGPSGLDSPGVIENALVNALLDNPRISLRSVDKEHIRTLCVTHACRVNVDGWIAAHKGGIRP